MAVRALNNQMNRIVRVNRLRLIATLTENREKHIEQFNRDMAGYKAVALGKINDAFENLSERLGKRKSELVEEVYKFSPETADRFSDHLVILQSITINLKVPASYADAYDAAIDMASFDTRDELELSGAEFQCFCRDAWDWSEDFRNTSAMYTKS